MNEKKAASFAAKLPEQTQMFANRLQKRFRHLNKWAQRTGTGAFRLYDRDIPEIPLVLDFYSEGGQPQDAVLSGALYKRPYEKNEADEEQWLSAMKESAALVLGIKPSSIFLKQRKKQRGFSQYEKMNHKRTARTEKIVSEGGLKFKVNLSDYLDTGLFIDRRLLRAMVRDMARGKKVLNLFSYTGSFSVYAAAGGAVCTDSVDLSNTYLNWAKENFALNGFLASITKKNFTTDHTNQHEHKINDKDYREEKLCAHKLIKADVLEFVKSAIREKLQWDIIIVDPPAFSNSKKMINDFDLNRDKTELLTQCLKLLSPGGEIILSVNLHRRAPAAQELEASLKMCVTDLGSRIEDEDFKGRKMPKAFLIREP
jgi:23S rRNA G2069 N7-methylase RlmK/C1962 C5-methylase RlmI